MTIPVRSAPMLAASLAALSFAVWMAATTQSPSIYAAPAPPAAHATLDHTDATARRG
jgi:hypothetical protein